MIELTIGQRVSIWVKSDVIVCLRVLRENNMIIFNQGDVGAGVNPINKHVVITVENIDVLQAACDEFVTSSNYLLNC